MIKMKEVKCHIINDDITIFEYYLLPNVKTFQVEIISKTKRKYIVGNFNTMKQAKEYVKRLCSYYE